LLREQLCDGVADCPQGEDESNCADISPVGETCNVLNESKGRFVSCQRTQVRVPEDNRAVVWIQASDENIENLVFFDGDETGQVIESLYSNDGWISVIAAGREMTIVGAKSLTINFEGVPVSDDVVFVHGLSRIVSHSSIETVIPGSKTCGHAQNPCPSVKSSLMANCQPWSSTGHEQGLIQSDVVLSFIADAAKVSVDGTERSTLAWLQCPSLTVVILPGVIHEFRLPLLFLSDSALKIYGIASSPLITTVDHRMLGTMFEWCTLCVLQLSSFVLINAKRISPATRYGIAYSDVFPTYALSSRATFFIYYSSFSLNNIVFDAGETVSEIINFSPAQDRGAYVHTSPVIPNFLASRCFFLVSPSRYEF
jgi:hypothetical protein